MKKFKVGDSSTVFEWLGSGGYRKEYIGRQSIMQPEADAGGDDFLLYGDNADNILVSYSDEIKVIGRLTVRKVK